MKIETRQMQEAKALHHKMVGMGLQLYLDQLMDAVVKGDADKLLEFQQMVQYAPPDLKARLMDRIDAIHCRGQQNRETCVPGRKKGKQQ